MLYNYTHVNITPKPSTLPTCTYHLRSLPVFDLRTEGVSLYCQVRILSF